MNIINDDQWYGKWYGYKKNGKWWKIMAYDGLFDGEPNLDHRVLVS